MKLTEADREVADRIISRFNRDNRDVVAKLVPGSGMLVQMNLVGTDSYSGWPEFNPRYSLKAQLEVLRLNLRVQAGLVT